MKLVNINLGKIKNAQKDLNIGIGDLSFCLVIGGWASGKSFWLDNIYNQLKEQMNPKELGFVLLNVSGGAEQINNEYIIEEHISNECLGPLVEYAKLARQRSNGDEAKDKHIIVHIEGNDLALNNNKAYLSLIKLLSSNAKSANMSLIIVDNRANEHQTPPEISRLCSLIALLSSDNYLPNAKYLGEAISKLDKFEKQIILNNDTYILEKLKT
jgi:hypothetical protein